MTDHLNDAPAQSAEKQFETLRAEMALHGHELICTPGADSPASYLASRWGMSRFLPDLDAVRAFVAQIWGRP